MIELIPAIDIIEGKCVRLSNGDYASKVVYGNNPVEIAIKLQDAGFKRLHVVDLDGAKSKHIVNQHILKEITSKTSLKVDFGGGIKTDEDIETAFASGASLVTIGSIAVTNKPLFQTWIDQYGPDRIILGADIRNGKISVNGWKEDTTEDLFTFLQHYTDLGIRNVLCTDISKDGMLSGPAFDLYEEIMKRFPFIHLIASGGISCNQDITRLNDLGIPAVVFGKAYYEGKINVSELWDWQRE